MVKRATFQLAFDCDSACRFCAQAPASGEAATVHRSRMDDEARLAELREHHEELSFIGGEPTLDPRLPKLVARARALGFRAIGLQTNAARLAADDELLPELIARGLSDLQLSIHAPSSAGHDYLTGRPGSFAACLELLERAQRTGLRCVVATVVTRSNFRELPRLPPALKRRGVAAWLLEVLRPAGRAAHGFARLVPRFGMAIPWALHGLEQARRHDLPAWIRGAPSCTLGPFVRRALDEPAHERELRAAAPACGECPAEPRCAGLTPGYLQVFGGREIRPRADPGPVLRDPQHERLLRMFVGVGVRVEAEPVLTSPSEPATAKAGPRRLPVLPSTSAGAKA